MRLKIEFAQASDPGRDPNKQINEDSCGYAETRFGYLCVLCDGMGGHYGGQEASRTAITTIFEVIEQMPASMSPAQALKAAIEEAARRVYRLGGPPENRVRPGSTVVTMLLHDRGLDVAHVGDSRAYVIRANQIYPLTRDHSMVQGMIDAGMLTEEQAIGHPDANKITRALGMKPEVEVEVRPEPMELFPGDILMQSSDGLTDLALKEDILGATRQALASAGVDHACNVLVRLANDRGGHDNITVQMVRIAEVGPKALTTIPQAPSAGAAGSAATTPPGAPLETIPMTAPDAPARPYAGASPPAGAGHWAPNPAAQQQPQQAAPSPQNAWAPVGPTATDHPPRAVPPVQQAPQAAQGPGPAWAPSAGPTVNEVPPASQPWTSGMYTGPPVQPASPGAPPPPQPGLANYQLDNGAGALPLPPPSMRHPPRVGPTQVSTHAGTQMAPVPPMAPQPVYTPAPPSNSMAGAHPSKGGIVFVIIGLSAMIAILLLVIVWAIFLR